MDSVHGHTPAVNALWDRRDAIRQFALGQVLVALFLLLCTTTGTAMAAEPSTPPAASVSSAASAAADRPILVLLDDQGRLAPPAPAERVVKSPADWRAKLKPEVFKILRASDTEPPFCGGLLHVKEPGLFLCAGCQLPLFKTGDKFESGTGWPSFTRPVYPGNLRRVEDHSHGMVRVEIRCARCDGHLGHAFDDGPAPTFERHCLNSLALTFRPDPAGK